ncbi:MAG: type II toxin-antitoxin system VapC family toxin [Acidobacteriota bacterium]
MAAFYFDTSALVKRYARETGSSWVVGITGAAANNEVFISIATGAEMAAALTRKSLIGQMSSQSSSVAIVAFKQHFKSEYEVASLTMNIVDHAMKLAEAHGLRGYDSIQLATALAVQSELASAGVSNFAFVSADADLNSAAQAEGLSVDDPNNHP